MTRKQKMLVQLMKYTNNYIRLIDKEIASTEKHLKKLNEDRAEAAREQRLNQRLLDLSTQ
jgi:hypothetical protein